MKFTSQLEENRSKRNEILKNELKSRLTPSGEMKWSFGYSSTNELDGLASLGKSSKPKVFDRTDPSYRPSEEKKLAITGPRIPAIFYKRWWMDYWLLISKTRQVRYTGNDISINTKINKIRNIYNQEKKKEQELMFPIFVQKNYNDILNLQIKFDKFLAEYYPAEFIKLVNPKIKSAYKESLIEQILNIEEKEADIKFEYDEFGKYPTRGRCGVINNLYTLIEDWNYIIPSDLNLKCQHINKFVLLELYL